MSMRNVLSTLLATLLVFNASCACAAMVVAPDAGAGAHAHHQQPAQETEAAPNTDCHSDCEDCESAAGVGLSKETSKPSSFKFGLDDLDWSVIDVTPYQAARIVGATGPPLGPISQAADTPVRRFDLQLE